MQPHNTQGTIVKSEDGKEAAICFERFLPHSIDRVWTAITHPKEVSNWFGKMTSQRREGGTITVVAGPERVPEHLRRTEGKILVWEPPHVIEYEWRQAIVEHSTVRYELSKAEGGTLLKFTHRWLSPRNASGFTPGTHAILDRLQAYLAGEALPDWQARYDEVAPLYPKWE